MVEFTTEYLDQLYLGPNPAALAGFLMGFVTMFWFRDLWFSIVMTYVAMCILVMIACLSKVIPEAFFPSIPDTIVNVAIAAPFATFFGIALSTAIETFHGFELPAILDHPNIDENFKDSFSVIYCTSVNKIQGLHEEEVAWWRHSLAAVVVQLASVWLSGWASDYVAVVMIFMITLISQCLLTFTLKNEHRIALGWWNVGVIMVAGLLLLIPYGTFPILIGTSLVVTIGLYVAAKKHKRSLITVEQVMKNAE